MYDKAVTAPRAAKLMSGASLLADKPQATLAELAVALRVLRLSAVQVDGARITELGSVVGEVGCGERTLLCKLHLDKTGEYLDGFGCANLRPGCHSALFRPGELSTSLCTVAGNQRKNDGKAVEQMKSVIWADANFLSGDETVSRFRTGAAVGLSVYGSGYCYLALFDSRARSRAARVLGALPLLIDVVRAWPLFGVRELPEIGFEVFQDGGRVCVHVSPLTTRASTGSLLRAMREVLGIVVTYGWGVRIGGKGACRLETISAEIGQVYGEMRAFCDFEFSQVQVDRQSLLKAWFNDIGIIVDDPLLGYLTLATTVTSQLPDYAGVKARFRLWACLGDRYMKFGLALLAVSRDVEVKECSAAELRQSNANLAAAASAHGFYEVVDSGQLSWDSSAISDVVEAVVGVLVLFSTEANARAFVRGLGIYGEATFQDHTLTPDEFCGVGDFQRGRIGHPLSSAEYAQALALRDSGLLFVRGEGLPRFTVSSVGTVRGESVGAGEVVGSSSDGYAVGY